MTKAPLIVNYGMGVDSTAMLINMHRLGEKPDLIIFADTGSEKPETYRYLAVMNKWLAHVGWPLVHVVKFAGVRVSYNSLEENCLTNETLPSLAFGMKSCSLRWKAEVMDRFLLGCKRGKNKCAPWIPESCGKPTKCIGYDAGPADSRRAHSRTEDKFFSYRYPLREWGWDRERCVHEIKKAGLPPPLKSACFFCPASKHWEVVWLAAKHPELFLRAVRIEDVAREGKHGLDTVKGLGRNWSWKAWAEDAGILKDGAIVMEQAEMLLMAEEAKPRYEANDCSMICEGDFDQFAYDPEESDDES